MQAFLNSPYLVKKDLCSLIHLMTPVALYNVPFHDNTPSITRYFAKNFPLHLAVHEVSLISTPPSIYTQPHIHDDFDELNIIISKHKLIYKIQLGSEEFTVSNNSCIYIPKGTIHSANVQKGHGYFITLRIN